MEDCQSWRIQSRTRELPLAIVTLTLCRTSDFCLREVPRASQPEPPASSSFSRSPAKYGLTTAARVELEANAAVVAKGNRDELQRRVQHQQRPTLTQYTALGRLDSPVELFACALFDYFHFRGFARTFWELGINLQSLVGYI